MRQETVAHTVPMYKSVSSEAAHSSASLQTCPELLRSVVACLAQITLFICCCLPVFAHTLYISLLLQTATLQRYLLVYDIKHSPQF